MKLKLSNLNFQRNGVSGEAFFSVISRDLKDIKGKFLITFYEDVPFNKVKRSSVRVVNLDKPKEKYRGDEIARDLENELLNLSKKHHTEHFFDLQGKI